MISTFRIHVHGKGYFDRALEIQVLLAIFLFYLDLKVGGRKKILGENKLIRWLELDCKGRLGADSDLLLDCKLQNDLPLLAPA